MPAAGVACLGDTLHDDFHRLTNIHLDGGIAARIQDLPCPDIDDLAHGHLFPPARAVRYKNAQES